MRHKLTLSGWQQFKCSNIYFCWAAKEKEHFTLLYLPYHTDRKLKYALLQPFGNCYSLLVMSKKSFKYNLKKKLKYNFNLETTLLGIYFIEINQLVVENICTECLLKQWSLWHKTKSIFHVCQWKNSSNNMVPIYHDIFNNFKRIL